ncbi:MAG: hypothetical protein U0X39_10275 [Bacteroidales bacterium]
MKILKYIVSPILLACIISRAATAQGSDIFNAVKTKFEKHLNIYSREDIYLHTDRSEYIAGEELWLNITAFDRQHLSASQSSIAYIELLNAENIPVVQEKFRLINGSGPGQIILPDSLVTGTYLLRAYTNRMKNFLPENSFTKNITVYNPFDVRIFRGRKPQHLSLPDSGSDPGKAGIKVTRQGNGLVVFDIEFDPSLAFNEDEKLLLFIQTRGNIDVFKPFNRSAGVTRLTVPDSALTRGINQVTIFNSAGSPVSERYIYTPGIKHDFVAEIVPADSFRVRGEISVKMKLPDYFAESKLSISVSPSDCDTGFVSIEDYMIFGSEYGELPYLFLGGRKLSSIDDNELDSLLGIIHSSWTDWKKILGENSLELYYPVETSTHYVEGLLLSNKKDLAFPGERLTISIPGKVAQFQYSTTDYMARFHFPIQLDINVQDLVVQPADTGRKYKPEILSSFPAVYSASNLTIGRINGTTLARAARLSYNYQVSKVYELSYHGKKTTGGNTNSLPGRFYGKPDQQVVMSNYQKLNSMEEIFFELIPRVTLKRNNNQFELTFLDYSGARAYDEDPVIMIDGVIIRDKSILGLLDPGVVEKIDIVHGIYKVGGFTFYGLVNVITNSGDILKQSLPEYVTRVRYRITDESFEFKIPDYRSGQKNTERVPDFRNVLYWNPILKADSSGNATCSFSSSDLPGEYILTVTAISPDGKSISYREKLIIK